MKKIVILILIFTSLYSNSQSNTKTLDKLSNKELKEKIAAQLSNFDQIEKCIRENHSLLKSNTNATDSINLFFFNSVSSLYKKLKYDYNVNFATKKKPEDWNIINEIYKNNLKSIDSLYELRNLAFVELVKSNLNSNKTQIESAKKQSELGSVSPSHLSCQSIDTTITNIKTCFNNFVRQKLTQGIEIPEFRVFTDELIKSFVTFIISKNGKLEFKKFAKSSGYFEYDMEIFLNFKKINKNFDFISGTDETGNTIDFYYTLPLIIKSNIED
jgi:hypothetical protein